MKSISFQRKPPILERLAIRNTAFYKRIQDGLLPPPVSLSNGRVSLWPKHEIDAVAVAMLAGKSDEDLRALVKQLVADRNAAEKVA